MLYREVTVVVVCGSGHVARSKAPVGCRACGVGLRDSERAGGSFVTLWHAYGRGRLIVRLWARGDAHLPNARLAWD
jgi:hypothetical protein